MSSQFFSRRDLLKLASASSVLPQELAHSAPRASDPKTTPVDPQRRSRTVEQHVATQLTVRSPRPYRDAYNEVDLDFHVIGPDGTAFIVPGYWEGEGLWSGQFAGEALGDYQLTTHCSILEDAGLHQQIFNVTCPSGERA